MLGSFSKSTSISMNHEDLELWNQQINRSMDYQLKPLSKVDILRMGLIALQALPNDDYINLYNMILENKKR